MQEQVLHYYITFLPITEGLKLYSLNHWCYYFLLLLLVCFLFQFDLKVFSQTSFLNQSEDYKTLLNSNHYNISYRRSVHTLLPYIYHLGQKNSAVSGISTSCVYEQEGQTNSVFISKEGDTFLYIVLRNFASIALIVEMNLSNVF